jgi:hypothetical protein
MDYRLECTLNETDLLRFYLYYWEHSELGCRQRRRQCLFVPLIYLALAAFVCLYRLYVIAGIFVLFAIAWYLLWPWCLSIRIRRFYASHIKETVGDTLREPRIHRLSPEGICSLSGQGDSVYRYSAVDRIVENDGYTYVFIGKNQALILPHDRLLKEAIDTFVAEIQRRRAAANDPAKNGPGVAS